MSLPVFFIILTSLTLLGALAALFASLRAAFGGTSLEPLAVGPGLPDRAALEDEKNSLLRALKDLEYEHEVGKIADGDYERLERAYRMRAKQVLGDLDRDLGPYLSQAEELVARSLGEAKPKPEGALRAGKKSKKKSPTPDGGARATLESEDASAADPVDEAPQTPPRDDEAPSDAPMALASPDQPGSAQPAEPAVRVCLECATKNDLDAAFCKRCASPLGSDPEASV